MYRNSLFTFTQYLLTNKFQLLNWFKFSCTIARKTWFLKELNSGIIGLNVECPGVSSNAGVLDSRRNQVYCRPPSPTPLKNNETCLAISVVVSELKHAVFIVQNKKAKFYSNSFIVFISITESSRHLIF